MTKRVKHKRKNRKPLPKKANAGKLDAPARREAFTKHIKDGERTRAAFYYGDGSMMRPKDDEQGGK